MTGYIDPVIANKMKDLMKVKVAAVEGTLCLFGIYLVVENFNLAKTIKGCIDHLKIVGSDIGQLVLSKKQAISQEDYDAATVLKVVL